MSEFSLSNLIGLLDRANRQGVNISFIENELVVKVPKGKQIEAALLDELRANKPFLIHYFENFANTGIEVNEHAIQKIERKNLDALPLSFAQERLWFLDQLEGSVRYHLPSVLRLKGKLNSEILERVFQTIINRHEVLRSVIYEKNGAGFQRVKEKDEWVLERLDFNEKTSNQNLTVLIDQLVLKPFVLSKDYMLRAVLIALGAEEHVLVLTMHHIASDAVSKFILVKEVVELYSAMLEGRPDILSPLGIQYADYANWQRNQLPENVMEHKLEYWKQKLHGVETLQLPADHLRPAVTTIKGGIFYFTIDKQRSEQVHKFSQQQGTTMFMTLLAVYKTLLLRYSGQQDICVGTSFARREQQELESLIGFFVNTLALRDNVDPAYSFIDLLKLVKATTLGAYEHQDVPLEKVVEAVVKERDPGRSPLFQVMFVWANTPEVSQLKLGDLEISLEGYELNTTKFDLTFFITETPQGLQGSVQYSLDLYHADTIRRMVIHFQQLLQSVLIDPHQKLGLLPMLQDTEQQQLLQGFNKASVFYPQDKTIVSLFEEQALKTPDFTAVVFENESLNYRELNERSNQLANYLTGQGIKQGSLVPMYLERSSLMMIALLGIIKSGAAYLPIDADLPLDRIGFILEDSDAAIVVTTVEKSKNLAGLSKVEIIELDSALLNTQPLTPASVQLSPNDLAYVIYTSGSTGNPKGVMVTHRNLADYVFGLNAKIQTDQCKSFALVSTIATDLGNTVVYASLLSGGALHLFSKETVSNAAALHHYFREHAIDCLKIVPSHWKALSMEERLLLPAKLLVFGGEPLRSELVENIFASHPACKVVNHYGPTETTIGKLLHVVDATKTYSRTIPIGKPFSNTRVYILSKNMQLCPVGVSGQIYVAGDGVARGYHNNAELTNEKFIADPFAAQPGSKMYGTGDMVRWLPDGNIEFIGRADDQVKIRGYRIELGEIELVLLQSPLVSEAVVIAKEDKQGNKRLAGYIVPVGGYNKEGMIEYMKEKLPDYMIPAMLMELESLPLTANGKIDRKSLPDPETSDAPSNTFTAPRTDAEKALAEIWQELLDIESIGIHDNFFEVGGDSIITIQLVSRARRAGYELQVGDVFTYQTIARLSALLDQRSNTSATVSGEQFLLEGACGLLPVQQWFFDQDAAEPSHFNQAILLRIDKGVSEALLKRAIEQLTAHHDALRFKYYNKDGVWYQVYEHQSEMSRVVVEDLQSVSAGKLSKLITEHCDRHQKSLDIEKGELVRVVLMQTPSSEDTNRLLFAVHHLAIDGVSWRILLEDLELLLTGFKNGSATELGNKTSSYRQWFDALVKYGQTNNILAQKNYWNNVVKNYQAIPVDKAYTVPVRIKDITQHTMRLDAAQTRLLTHDVPRVYHTEINDILMAALAKTFTEFGGTDKVIIGMEGHGRESIEDGVDTSRTVGWFTTHYPVLLKVNTGKGEDDLIKNIKEQLRQIPDKGLGFGVLKYINKEEAYLGKSRWDVIYNYLGQADNVFNTGQWLSMATEAAGADKSPDYIVSEKLVLNGRIQGGELILNWSYSEKQYEKETIIALVNKFQANLQSLIQHCIDQQKNEGVVFTPSDYGLGKEISYSELDTFLNQPVNGLPASKSLERMYRLSGLQQGMLFHGLYDGDGAGYLTQFWCDLIDPDLDALRNSWKQVMRSHSILRTAFYPNAFLIPVQAVYKEVDLSIDIIDYRSLGENEQAIAIKEFELADKAKGFDFTKAPLMRVSLLRLDDNRYRMLWSAHHILFDGWSRSILMGDLLKIYDSLVTGNPLPVMVDDQYVDYIRYIELINKEDEQAYWKKYLQHIGQSSLLPFIGTTAERNKGIGTYKSVVLNIDKRVTEKVGEFAQRNRLTINTLVQGIWAYLLHRYTGSSDIVYGVIVSGRPDDLPQVEQRVGMFINVIPLRTNLNEEETFAQWLTDIQQDQVTSRNHQYTPLREIQAWAGLQGDLFDSLLVFENYPVSKVIKEMNWNLQVDNVRVNEQTNYPLTLKVTSADEISVDFGYNSSLLDDKYINAIRGHFQHVLLQVIENENTQVKHIEILTGNEKNWLIVQLNNTAADYPKHNSLVGLFEEQVLKTPDGEAVVFGNNALTYQQLNERSNQLARHLISKGVKAKTLVPICIERGLQMIVGVLGILKAGGAYVPIDPAYPEERINYILEDTQALILLTNKAFASTFSINTNAKLVCVDDELAGNHPSIKPAIATDQNVPACIIYTSGSTGRPKGVLLSHAGIINRLEWMYQSYPFELNERNAIKTSIGFVDHIWELFGALCAGIPSVIFPQQTLLDLDLLIDELTKQKITRWVLVPSLLKTLLNKLQEDGKNLPLLKYWTSSGETLSYDLVKDFYQYFPVTNHTLLNIYGSSEVTADVSCYDTSFLFRVSTGTQQQQVPIGKPISNTTLYLLDKQQHLVAQGVAGEICVGGIQVAQGYLNLPELTAERFINDPFSQQPDAKIFRTGDYGRMAADGNIIYLGRIDDQVKIRGNRVEPGEIETVLKEQDQIKDCVVVAKTDNEGHNNLIGYFVAESIIDPLALRTILRERLPDYMVPVSWVQLEMLPLTASGKIDKKALPDADESARLVNTYTAPTTALETKLTIIWQELLQVKRIGVHDNFFELGGHSLLAMRLVSLIRKELKVELAIKTLFTHSTIAALAAQLGQHNQGPLLPLIQANIRPALIPLSFTQERLWFIDQLEGTVQYHLPAVIKLTGKLNRRSLNDALQMVVDRHEVLRTVIDNNRGEPTQHIMDGTGWKMLEADARSYKNDQLGLQRYIAEFVVQPFNLSADYMLRATLAATGEDEYLLLITMHHIAADGWSLPIIVKEVTQLYRAYVQGFASPLAPLELQYADYAVWQRNYLQGPVLDNKLKYWKEKLKAFSVLQMPADFARPPVQSTAGTSVGFSIDKQLTSKLQMLALQERATLFMTLLAAFKVLLRRYSGQNDICVGTPVAGRQQTEVEGLAGFFANTLALRTEVNEEDSFITFLSAVKQTTLDAYEHQDTPFEKVVELVVKERDMSRSPLFQVMFVLQNVPAIPEMILPELGSSWEMLKNNTAKFDISFYITETAKGLQGSVEYCTALYKDETISRMIGHYKELLAGIVASPNQKTGLLPMITNGEKDQVLFKFNHPIAAYPKEKTIIDLFEEQAVLWPENIALVFENEELTYKELNERANQLAHYLINKGVKEETLVPLCLERSINMIVGILGILKSGGAYVPVDADYPFDRISYILEDTAAKVVVSSLKSSCRLPTNQNIEIIEIDGDAAGISQMPIQNPSIAIQPASLAYVIYTSGSTGKPKGVLIEHRNVTRLFKTSSPLYDFTEKDVWSMFHSFSFDFSVWEIFGALFYGGRLVIVPVNATKDISLFAHLLIAEQVTILNQTPSSFYVLQENMAGKVREVPVRFVIFGGEALHPAKLKPWKASYPNTRLINMYGITETTVHVTYQEIGWEQINEEKSVIGKPIPTLTAYVLDAHRNLCPTGIPGELCIGGEGLARGYLNLPLLTAELFIADPFSNIPGARLYRSGDLGRWVADGNIEYLGRIDDQVKINGYRIELAEIENVLEQCGFVSQAVVVAKEDAQGMKQLAGYVVPFGAFDREGIINHLLQKLPGYMVPALWVEMQSLPLNANGKTDRKALPGLDVSSLLVHNYVAPENDIEIALVEIWQQLLGLERIGTLDNFFELGGHSLLAMRVVASIRKDLELELDIKHLFAHPTIRSLSSHLKKTDKGLILPSIQIQLRPTNIPLSFSQERLWFINKLEGSLQYHLPTVLRLKGKLNIEALNKAIQFIVNRHEVLRTVIMEEKGVGSQVVKDKDGWQLNIEDAQHYKQEPQNLKRYIQQLIKAPFDLSSQYMLRANLLMIDEADYLLVVTMHHIASDGWSTSIIVKELVALYSAFTQGHPVHLQPLSIQYADYAIWQRKYVQGEVLNTMLDYWKQKLPNVATLDLPTDFKRPAVQSSNGATTSFLLDKELHVQLNLLSRQQGTTLFMTLLSAFKVLLHRYSGQQDICVGTPMANRTRQEVEPLIGFFINTLAIRSDLGSNPSFTSLLQQVKATTLEAYANQEAPFEKVVEAAVTQRDMGRNPLFQVLFTMQNTPEIPALHLDGVSISVQPTDRTTAQLDIICNIAEKQDGLYGQVEYCTDLYSEQTIKRMMGHYRALLYAVVKEPSQRIGEIQMLDKVEEERLLNEFNDTRVDTVKEETIVDLFEAQALKTPANIALVFKDEKLNYQQLNERGNQLAAYLKRKGVKDGQLIPICTNRSVEMLTGIWAILKAGAVYVPIDPAYPVERIGYILQDTRASIILSSEESLARLPGDGNFEVISIDGQWADISNGPSKNLATPILPTQLAYIIYTSGSTGKPKGVMITHANLVAYLCNQKTNYISVDNNKTGSFIHLSYTFDASLTAMFMPMLKGKMIVLGSKGLAEVFEDDNLHKYAPYDFIKITPSHIALLQPKMKLPGGGLLTQKLVIGGEALLAGQLSLLVAEEMDVEIINEYGPTEATVGCTVFSLNTRDQNTLPEYSIPIGKPINNVQIHILGGHNELLPQGAAGEICIAGAGIAAGYLNLGNLTAQKFVTDPYSERQGAKMYKTGDIARWLPDGNIQYLGRKDEQVKIRGYRIELGEIENVLQQSGLVSQCVVTLEENKDGTKRLAAYLVAKENFDLASLSDFLKSQLPEYMVPSTYVEIESLPLTSNGKIDKKALLNSAGNVLLISLYEAPRNETETAMAEIWEELLEVENPGIHDDFFNLGGHSLLAIRLVSAIRKKLEVEIAINFVFEYPTIATLAANLEGQRQKILLPPVEIVRSRPQFIPLSFNQERLWFIDRLEGSVQYHVPAVIRLNGKVNIAALEYTLTSIVNRHEVLRSVIREQDGRPYQYILDTADWQLNITDGAIYQDDVEGLGKYINKIKKQPFDLSKDYMLRAHLISLNPAAHILVVTLHHIASDGWSMSVIVKEVTELYNSYVQQRETHLAPLAIQYADYAIWQRNNLQGEILDKKTGYWKDKLQDAKILRLPTDYERPAVQSTRGAMVSVRIDKGLSDQLLAFCQQQGTTLFMTLLSAFKVLLYRYSGQTDVCVGTAIAGRQSQELEALIGFFVNTLALRNQLDGDGSFVALLQQVKKTTMEAYENQELPFEKVVETIVGKRDLGTDPLIQIMFALQNTPDIPVLQIGEAALSVDKYEDDTALFELWLNIAETPEGLGGYVKYCTDLYSRQTIERMVAHYCKLLQSIIDNPLQQIATLEMLSEHERHQMVVDFNDNALPYPREKSIVALFEEQVLKTPGKTAVVFEDEQLTYQQLNERSNQLAHYLSGRGAFPGMLIPVCVERGLDLIISILAILKSGAAYVPLDPEYPVERINYMLADTAAVIVIRSSQNKPKFQPSPQVDIIDLDNETAAIGHQPITSLQMVVEPDSLAYIIYTSGSTGNPKGVMIEHGNVVSLVKGIDYVALTENDILLSTGSPSFDATTIEYWGMLLNGGQLVLCPENTLLDNDLLKAEIIKRRITKMWFTSSWFNQLVAYDMTIFKTLQTIMAGGEKLSEPTIQKIRETYPYIEIINGYGPTENTTFSLTHRIREVQINSPVPIGRPLNNRSAFIVDGYGQLVPVGVPGEIWLGGAGLARGYLNRSELTAEKFTKNPFETGGLRLYKTGDEGRRLPDGTILFIKRLDDQVKIRGYRIELGEIETVMNRLEQVDTSCVVVKADAGINRMVAYYMPGQQVVKVKERQLYTSLVATWKELYETEYAKTELAADIDPEFNIIGWNDSFTGQPIPPEQMREWLNDIMEVIMFEGPEQVLEIGSGTGLIYYQLAGKIKKYTGTDFSASSVKQVSDRISKGARNYGPTELLVCAAHEVSVKEEEQVDTVILNSIVQYFPGEDYMTEVIGKAIDALKGNGRIIVGDVRDNRLLELFKGRLQIKKMQDSAGIKEFKWAVAQEVLKEEELCFSPDYFYKLQSLFPQVTHVEIKWKQGTYINELTLYRFTVIIYVGSKAETVKPDWQDWESSGAGLSVFSSLEKNKIVALNNVPNPRLWQERLLNKGLQDKTLRTVGDLVNVISQDDNETTSIQNLLQEVVAKGFSYRMMPDKDPLKINVVFEPKPSHLFIEQPYNKKGFDKTTGSLTNIPLLGDITSLLQKDIRLLLQQSLPDYMIPAEIIAIAQLPLTNNGKVDRVFLSQLEDRGKGNKFNYVAPQNETEQVLANIWQELLGIEAVSIHDNFFEIGGHSLLATRVKSAIRKQLEKEVAIKDLFMHPTIALLGEHLQFPSTVAHIPSIEMLPRPTHIPLSFSQERLWFIDQLEGSVPYNSPAVLRLKGKLNKEALIYTLQNIISRHEVLRTVFQEAEGMPFQTILGLDGWMLTDVDGSLYKEDKAGLQSLIENLISSSFDLSKDYMLRADLITLDEEDYVLVVTIHHIAYDGWSLPIIVKEVVELYSAYIGSRPAKLPTLPLQFADYAIWQRKYLQGQVLEEKTAYWINKLHGVTPLQLATDYSRPAIRSGRGASVNFMIDKQLSDQLNRLSQQQGTTLFMTLLATYNILLNRYSSQQDICVGASIANRPQQELEGLIGFFVNTLALRTEVDETEKFIDLLQQVKTTTLDAYEHQDVPFEKVVEAVVKDRDPGRTPLFQVMLVLLNTPEPATLGFGEIILSHERFENKISKFDITFHVSQSTNGLPVSIEYNTDLFREDTIIRMAGHFKQLLRSVVIDPKEKIDLLQMLTEAEEQQLLVEFD